MGGLTFFFWPKLAEIEIKSFQSWDYEVMSALISSTSLRISIRKQRGRGRYMRDSEG